MSYPLGKSFRIEDILNSQHGKYLTVQRLWWNNYSKLAPGKPVGGQTTDKKFVTMTKCDPLYYDGVSNTHKVPTFQKPLF